MWNLTRNRGSNGVVGVELGGDAVACAHVTRQAGQPGASVFEYLPADAADAPAVLADFVQRHHLKGADCVGVMPQGAYQLLQVEPPDVPDEEKRQAIKWRLRDRVDFPVAEAVVDIFEPPAGARRRAGNLNAVVCRASVVARSAEAILASALRLQALDVVELVQRNVLAALRERDEAIALLTFRENDGLITLVKAAELYLARNLDIGLASLRVDGEAGAFAFESIVLELQRSLDYYESSFGMPAINSVLAYPQATGIDPLLAHIGRTLPALQTDILDPGAAFAVHAEVPHGCLNAFGAALRVQEAA